MTDSAPLPIFGSLGFFARSTQHLIFLYRRDLTAIRDRWQDEASTAALNGNPNRARYLEDMARRV